VDTLNNINHRGIRNHTKQNIFASTGQNNIVANSKQTSALNNSNLQKLVSNITETDITIDKLDNVFEEANNILSNTHFRLSYSIHENTNRIIVTVYDSFSDEVIREIPEGSRLDALSRALDLTGLFFDEVVE